jgi:hypothetical protein
MTALDDYTRAAQTDPTVERLAREYPYGKADITGVYVVCRGDIAAVELIVRLSIRPIDSNAIAAMLDVLRGNR